MVDIKLLFPSKIDNQFRGKKISLWFFYLITVITLWRSQHHLLALDGGAQSIAKIPLDSYSFGASSTIIGIFALWGLSQLIIGIIYFVAIIRYRSMIPFLYLLGIVEYTVRPLIGLSKHIETIGRAPGAYINIPFVLIFFIMLLLSLWKENETSN